MKKVLQYLLLCGLLFCKQSFSQVVITNTTESAVGVKGYYNQSVAAKEIRITESSALHAVSRENAKPVSLGKSKLDVALDTSVSLAKFANWQISGDYSITRIKISVPRTPSIRLYFKKMRLPENAEIYIYNEAGTSVLGPITQKENTRENQLWGTNTFKANSVVIEIRVLTAQKSSLILDLNKIMFGYRKNDLRKQSFSRDSLLFKKGYLDASICNVDVLCPLGSGFAVERRGVALIQMPDGSCSGFMVNDACNSRTPYLMTAYHCTNGENVANWQFIFHYWGPYCNSGIDGSKALLFNGATLRATWIETDFSLLELFTQPAINTGISYLGWNRTTTTPSSGIGIHHPMGDVMKISEEPDAATIGNIQGYTNTGWRVRWNTGTVEPGSSGSPFFGPDNLVRGQLYSNTQPETPPCNAESGGTNYGRFDISWTGGGTSATRLSNWLDPQGLNPGSIATLDPVNQYVITGPNQFCTTGNYSLGSLPAGSSVTAWNVSPGYASPSPSGNSVTLTKSIDGVATLSATITDACGGTQIVSKQIDVGAPVNLVATPQTCDGGSRNWYLYLNPLSYTTSGYSWSVTSGSGITIYSPSSPNTLVGVTGGGTVSIAFTDYCGASRNLGTTVYNSGCYGFRLIASPNPTKGNLNLSLEKETINAQSVASTEKPVSKIQSAGKTIISVYDANTSQLVKQWKQNEAVNSRYTLNIAGLRKGVYIVQLDRDNTTTQTKIIVE